MIEQLELPYEPCGALVKVTQRPTWDGTRTSITFDDQEPVWRRTGVVCVLGSDANGRLVGIEIHDAIKPWEG
jgi:hypothetical protein